MKNYQKFAAKYASEVMLPPPPGEEELLDYEWDAPEIPSEETAPKIQSEFPAGFLESLKDRMIMYESHHPNAETIVPGEEDEERSYETPIPPWKKRQQGEEVVIPTSAKVPQDLASMLGTSSSSLSTDAIVKLCNAYFVLTNK